MRCRHLAWAIAAGLCVPAGAVRAQAQEAASADATQQASDKAVELDRVEVVGRRRNLVGSAISASEGTVSAEDLARRPMLRTGDLVEFVPGMVATQHSGSGKASQYFLRGFNLDHGTDFATSVDGMSVNMRTHGHGQGYTDLNFLIPELVETLRYRKGTYYADVGDFSAAGSARFELADRMDPGLFELGVGEDGWRRVVFARSFAVAGNDPGSSPGPALLVGAEVQGGDGPWRDIDEDVRKRNVVLRYSGDAGEGRFHVTAMGYRNRWNSADQIPERAVEEGLIPRLGSLDTTVGGESSRASLSGGWSGPAFGGHLEANAYAISYKLDLWSDFTYVLDHPETGDQFEQYDDRRIQGFEAVQEWDAGRAKWQLGVQARRDDIGKVGLYHTQARRRLDTVREDAVVEESAGIFLANEMRWTDRLRSYLGVRYDGYRFDVHALQPANSGRVRDGIVSPKASLAWQATGALDLYASWGEGFHSNDARGTTLHVDPASSDPADPVDPLVKSHGAELGARLRIGSHFNATLGMWRLKLDSELLFVGDAGNTEASRPSERRGVELGMYWFPNDRIAADAELSWTRARFTDADPAGDYIPGSIPFVANIGLRAGFGNGWYASGRVRHFSAYPLIEDDGHRSAGTTTVNLRIGKDWQRFGLSLDLLNALDSHGHDIDYWYASRLPGEPADGVEDRHFHPMEPRALRLAARWTF